MAPTQMPSEELPAPDINRAREVDDNVLRMQYGRIDKNNTALLHKMDLLHNQTVAMIALHWVRTHVSRWLAD